MASSLAIYYTPMHFMWGVKSGATPVAIFSFFFKSEFTQFNQQTDKHRTINNQLAKQCQVN